MGKLDKTMAELKDYKDADLDLDSRKSSLTE